MASPIYNRRSATNRNTPIPTRLLPMNMNSRRPTRPVSTATSIDGLSDVEDTRRKPTNNHGGWQTRKENMLMRPMVEEDDVSDAESFDSLSTRAKFMSDLLSDNESIFSDGRNSIQSISTYGPRTPQTPSFDHIDNGYVEIMDERTPRSRAASMESPQGFGMKTKEMRGMTTVGPRGPHLFRSYSTGHSMSITNIHIPPSTPSLTDASQSPVSIRMSQQHSPISDSEPVVDMRPRSQALTTVGEYDIEEVRGWSPNQVCVWMAALGFDQDLVDNFAKNDITGNILIDLTWDDLKELDIQSFGKRIELWTEIHHLRSRTIISPDRAEFSRLSTRLPRNSVPPTPRMRSNSSASMSSQMMVLRSPSLADFGSRALPDIPTPLPAQAMQLPAQAMQLPALAMQLPALAMQLPAQAMQLPAQAMQLPAQAMQPEEHEHELEDEADEENSDNGHRQTRRLQLRKKMRRTNVRMPSRSVAVDSIIITSDGDFPGRYVAKVEAMTSFENSRPIGRSRSKRDSLAPSDSISLRAVRMRKKKGPQAAIMEEGERPHRCKKGDQCQKHKNRPATVRQRPKSDAKSKHGTIFIATTPSIVDFSQLSVEGTQVTSPVPPRPMSSAYTPSAVASSDALGPIQRNDIRLKEGALRDVTRVDPLESVKQFLTHQHQQHLEERRASPPPVPAKPTGELLRAQRSTPPPPNSAFGSTFSSNPRQTSIPTPSATPSLPFRSQTPSFGLRIQGMEQVVPPYANFAIPSRIHSPNNMMRTTTPLSEADVPCPTGSPLALRNQSQSVPPDMQYRRFPTPTIESLREPLPSLRSAGLRSNLNMVDENAEWEPVDEEPKMAPSPNIRTHSGWMKKRRTNWFRHEWPDHHFVLKGTRLGYANDVGIEEIGAIDMDEYQVACSNSGSTKLSAAFKSGRIFGKKKDEAGGTHGSYFFQLVPANEVGKGGKRTLGKVHCFAVSSREERIDWMRELMLAKAIKQKGQGYEVEVNGERV